MLSSAPNSLPQDYFLNGIFSSAEDVQRCREALLRLNRNFGGALVLTGGIAIAWHLADKAVSFKKRSFNDIDLVVEGLDSLPRSLSNDFLISHFHPSRGAGKILIQLVDEPVRTRIDVFTPYSPTLMNRVQPAHIGGINCRLVSAEDLTARLGALLVPVASGEQVDPKHYERFKSLLMIVDNSVVQKLWPDYRKDGYPVDFQSATALIHEVIKRNPRVLQKESYDSDVTVMCNWCVDDDLFPLISSSKMVDVLGYV